MGNQPQSSICQGTCLGCFDVRIEGSVKLLLGRDEAPPIAVIQQAAELLNALRQ